MNSESLLEQASTKEGIDPEDIAAYRKWFDQELKRNSSDKHEGVERFLKLLEQ